MTSADETIAILTAFNALSPADRDWLRDYGPDSPTLADIQAASLNRAIADEPDMGAFVTAGTIAHPGSTAKLMEYWAHGEGAVKIGWGRDGSFDRCVRHLAKYFPKDPKGLCANLHHRATGEWPTEHGKAGIPS